MPREDAHVVRQPMVVASTTHRRFEERLGLRFPRILALATRAWLRLPPRSRPRRALMRRTVRLGIEAANRRDYQAAFGLYASGVELLVPPELAALGFEASVRGRAERIRFETRWRAEWGEFRYAPEELSDLGSRVLVVGRMRGSGPTSGAAFDNEWADLFTLAGGRVVREHVFLDHAAALQAAGLQALQPAMDA